MDKPRRLRALEVALALIGAVLIAVAILAVIEALRADVREAVRTHFAAVRRNPAAWAAGGDAELREAHALVAESARESLPWLTSAGWTGSPVEHADATWCLRVSVTGPRGARKLGVIVTEQSRLGRGKLAVTAMSARRTCACPGKRQPCRLR